uniref:Hairy/enhancer-of-split related with YRPW motif protein 2 n=1 Tax=Mola mola TaxID=94237 RepID=A0A3Q3WXI6_MOLML
MLFISIISSAGTPFSVSLMLQSASYTQVMARKKRRGIIEKRRRDRINNSLSELRRLVPTALEKQGSAKLEKAEILQMTVDHLKVLQATGGKGYLDAHTLALDFLSLGFRECVTEVSRYLSAVEGLDTSDPLRARLLSHLTYCVSQRDAVALAVTSHSHYQQHQRPPPVPHPFHPHHWAAPAAAFRPLPAAAAAYGLSGLSVSTEAGLGGAPQRPRELIQCRAAASFAPYADSTASSSPSASLLSLSASFPITLHRAFPLPPSSITSPTSPPASSSSSQTPHSGRKPYRPWGTEVGAF